MKTRTSDIYSLLRKRVASGELAGGTRISELGLSKELGISRGPVREAVMRMTGEGLLEYVPSAGTFVKQMTRQDLTEIYQLRLWIEGEAAAEAVSRVTGRELRELQSNCDQLNRLCDSVDGVDAVRQTAVADLSFHIALLKASGNSKAVKLVTDQHLLSSLIGRVEGSWNRASVQQNYQEHQSILDAVREGDATTARDNMRSHIALALEDALENFDRNANRIAAAEALGVIPEEVTEHLRDIENLNHHDE